MASPSRIAVVASDPATRMSLVRQLAPLGHVVEGFADGAAALQALLLRPFQAVVTRQRVATLDGLALARAVRDLFPRPRIPVLIADEAPEDAGERAILSAYEAGAVEFLLEPFPPALLRAKLARHLTGSGGPRPALAPLPTPPADELPTTFGPWRLLRRLGEGGFGVVYEASRDGEAPMALKLFGAGLLEEREQLARVLREIATLGRARGIAHLVRLGAAGYEQGLFYVTTELVPGLPAHRLLAQEGPLAPARALDLVGQVARALTALHGLGILHRDVKPGNIMVDPEGRATLIDLGLAIERHEPALTAPWAVWGSGAYMAPEVLEGVRDDPKSDVYSLGATLYQLLSACVPYDGDPDETARQLHERIPPQPLSSLRPDLPAVLLTLVEDLMHLDPRRRPPSMLAAERRIVRVQEIVRGQPAPLVSARAG